MKKIKIIYDSEHPQLQDCPIGCIRHTATIVINPVLFYQLNEFDRKFWLLHEEGHIVLNTDSETLADEYAFNKLAGSEHKSLKQMVKALDTLLDDSNPETEIRKETLYKNALNWDKTH